MDATSKFDFHNYVDLKTGAVAREIFSDPNIYQLELERIFGRAWNFMCHESQIPNPGDFFLNYIGEESVIATRDKKGGLQVLLNSCRHRGNAVCRAESGTTRSFLCTYHGWTYDLEGKLIGVPGYKDLYHECLDRAQWGLVKAAKVQSYKGFVFANMDPDAPELEEYLGPVGRLGLDLATARGEMVMFDGVQKNVVGCNWKMAVDNLYDWYHPQLTHASAFMTMAADVPPLDPNLPQMEPTFHAHRVVLGEYGHAIGGPRMSEENLKIAQEHHDKLPDELPYRDHAWRGRPEVMETLGELGTTTLGHPGIFPNLWIASGGTQLCLRLPRGPEKCELWWFSLREKGLPEKVERARLWQSMSSFGPAGLLEQEDGENWDQSTRATRGPIARRYPLNYQMNLGKGEIQTRDGMAFVDTQTNEHGQLWTLQAWADWMSSGTWSELRASHTAVPEEVI